jgi:hypothetical protein
VKETIIVAAFIVFSFCTILYSAQEKPEWVIEEFSQEPVPVAAVESFLNDICHTSGLDGIQMLAVQPGHNQTQHLHVYCRPGKAANRYRVFMVPIPDRNPDKAVKPFLANPKVRVGPFYFGKDGEPDGVLIVEEQLAP